MPLPGPSDAVSTLLVTTFAPSTVAGEGATEAIADALAGDDRVVSHVLDVSWERSVAEARSLVRLVAPSAVVAFAVAPGADAVHVEETAHNLDDADEPDVDGVVRSAVPIDPDGPRTRPTRLPVEVLMTTLLAEGLSAVRSRDTGRGVANHLFHELLATPEVIAAPVGMVRVPGGWTTGAQVRAARVVVTTLLHHLPPP